MKNFFDCKDEKITEKAFVRLVATSILGILICIVCLCSTTYAWFTDSVSGGSGEIKSAGECLLSVDLKKDGVSIDNIENGVELEADIPYTVTISLPSNDSSSGYCLISAGENTYYSDYIDREDAPKTISFTLTVKTTQTVTFTTRWGIYSGDSSVVNGELIIP